MNDEIKSEVENMLTKKTSRSAYSNYFRCNSITTPIKSADGNDVVSDSPKYCVISKFFLRTQKNNHINHAFVQIHQEKKQIIWCSVDNHINIRDCKKYKFVKSNQ